MAQPIWRDVAAPDFSGSMSGLVAGGNMISQASRGLGDALLQYDQTQRQQAQDANDSALLSRAAQITDPNQFRQALSDGSLFQGIDPTKVSNKASQLLTAHMDSLQNQRMADHSYDIGSKYDAPLADATLTGKNLGNQGQVLVNQNRALQNTEGAYDFAHKQTSFNDNQEANRFVQSVLPKYADIDGARLGIQNDPAYKALSPEAQQHVNSQLGAAYGSPLYGPVQQMNMGPSGNNPYTQVYGNGSFGSPTIPLTSMPISGVMDYQNSQINRTKGKIGQGGNGTSAVGAGQLTRDTIADFAPKIFGSNWQNMAFTPQVQDQIRGAVIQSAMSKPDSASALKGRFSSLQNVPDATLKNASPQQIDQLVLAGENHGNLRETMQNLGMVNAAGQLQVGDKQSSLNTPVDPNQWVSAGQAGGDSSTVASNLVQNDPRFKGADERQLTSKINDISSRYGVNPSRAALLLSASGTSHSPVRALLSFGGRVGNYDTNLSNNFTYDQSRLDQLGKDAADKTDTGLNGRILSSLKAGSDGQMANAATVNAQQAISAYQALAIRAQTQPQLIQSGELERYRQRALLAQKIAGNSLGNIAQNDSPNVPTPVNNTPTIPVPTSAPKNYGPTPEQLLEQQQYGSMTQPGYSTSDLINRVKKTTAPTKLSNSQRAILQENIIRQRMGLPPLAQSE